MVPHLLLEFLERPAQARRARRRADSEHARRRSAVQLEQDAQREHLPLAGRELGERRLERRRQPFEPRLPGLGRARREARLPATTPLLGAEMVEGRVARDVAEPRARRRAARVEAPPRAEGLLERVAREVFGDGSVSGHEQQVAVDGVEVLFGDRGEARPRAGANAHPRRPGAHRRVHTSFYVAAVGSVTDTDPKCCSSYWTSTAPSFSPTTRSSARRPPRRRARSGGSTW